MKQNIFLWGPQYHQYVFLDFNANGKHQHTILFLVKELSYEILAIIMAFLNKVCFNSSYLPHILLILNLQDSVFLNVYHEKN